MADLLGAESCTHLCEEPPKEGSRLTVNIQLGPGIAGKLQASSDNCAKLVEMLKTYIVPNLAR